MTVTIMNTPRTRPLAGLLLSCLGLAACATATRPPVEVFPGGGSVDWRSGHGVVTKTQDAVQVGAAFDFATRDLLAFELTVENLTDAPLTIDPRRAYYATCASASACPTASPVMGPDWLLADLERRRAREEANADDDLLMSDVLLVLSAAADVSAIGNGHARAGRETGGLSRDASAATQASSMAHDRTVRRIDDQQKKWSSSALRLTTLAPRERVSGYVFVPLDRQAKLVWLDLLAGGQRFSFRFEQFIADHKTVPKRVRRASDPPE